MPAPAVKSSGDKQHAVTKVRAKFPFDAPKDTHLKFNKDDIIVVTEKQDKWWKGRCHEKVRLSLWIKLFFLYDINLTTFSLKIVFIITRLLHPCVYVFKNYRVFV